MGMRIVSYNCRSLLNQPDKLYSRPGVVEILNNNDVDILCLQETWRTKQDSAYLNNLHRKFHGIGESAVDDRDVAMPLVGSPLCGEHLLISM